MKVSRPERIRAEIHVPPDKSISHRWLIFNAIADGEARAENLLQSEDVRSTQRCLEALGVTIDWPEGQANARIQGMGLHGLFESDDVLDCGNSGTTMRLLSGLLAGNPLLSVLTGDASLRSRPMSRIITPLRQMGATVHARKGDTLAPLVIKGGGLRPIHYRTPMASAQVKSAILLAGLYADGETAVTEPAPSRNHTELLLREMGADVRSDGCDIRLTPPARLRATSLRVPGDISSAAPWLVLAACHPDAELRLVGVNTNQTRTGLLDIMRSMGADISLEEERVTGGEPVADIVVRSSRLVATEVSGQLVPRAIDELPLVAVLGACAEGRTVVRDAQELLVKESNRVESVVRALAALGAKVTGTGDGFVVEGGQPFRAGRVDGGGDHRIGMLGAIAGSLAGGQTRIDNDAVGVSYPGFWQALAQVTGTVDD